MNAAGTVHVFWSTWLDTEEVGRVYYKTSTDLGSWTAKATVGQTIGPEKQSATHSLFDIKKLNSGLWAMTWLDKSQCSSCPPPDNGYINNWTWPVVWYAISSDLPSVNWSNKQELTLPYTDQGVKQGHVGIGQTSSGTVYVGFTVVASPATENALYYRTSNDDGGSWTSKTIYGYEPSRPARTNGSHSLNPYFALDSTGYLRSFWDQDVTYNHDAYTDAYPKQPFYRDLPSGLILPVPAARDPLSRYGPSIKNTVFAVRGVNVATGSFTLPEIDVSIPARGLPLTFRRTYNAGRLVDGPLGFGWTLNYDSRLFTFTRREVLIITETGRNHVYMPNGSAYAPPLGQFSTLVHNGDGT